MFYPKVQERLAAEKSQHLISPPEQIRFKALELTDMDDVRIVFLGPGPYNKVGVSNGLAFSVRAGHKKYPAALNTLFREYQRDLGFGRPVHGDLRVWAERGVLLLNCNLSCSSAVGQNHQFIGWEKLTYEIVRRLSNRGGVFFALFGAEAAAYEGAIDLDKNALMVFAYPGNLGNRLGLEDVYGSGLFSECAAYLGESKQFWRLPGT